MLRSFRYLILISDPVMTLQRKQEENILQFCEFQIGSRLKKKNIYIYIQMGCKQINCLEYESKPIVNFWFLRPELDIPTWPTDPE